MDKRYLPRRQIVDKHGYKQTGYGDAAEASAQSTLSRLCSERLDKGMLDSFFGNSMRRRYALIEVFICAGSQRLWRKS